MSEGQVELAVMVDHVETHGVVSQRLLTEVLYLIAWPKFPIPEDPVPLVALARMPLILPSSPNSIRNRIDWALREASLPCEIRFEASSTALLLAAVIARLGVTILPWPAADVELDEHKIKLARVGHRLFSRDLSLCWHDTQLLSNAVQNVRLTMLEMFEQRGRRPEWTGEGRVTESSPRSKAGKTSRGR